MVSATISEPDEWRVAIIGAGFSGTAVAINLLRAAAAARSTKTLRIALIDPRAEIGAGVAYATRDYPYPLNVAAGQMSLDGTRPGDFLDFLRSQGIHAAPGDYLPRQVYGDYLRARFAAGARGGATVVEVRAPPRECVAIATQRWPLGPVARQRQRPGGR